MLSKHGSFNFLLKIDENAQFFTYKMSSLIDIIIA